jgi:hypothetical protein
MNPLVTFYDIHRGKREVLFFYFVPISHEIVLLKMIIFIKLLGTRLAPHWCNADTKSTTGLYRSLYGTLGYFKIVWHRKWYAMS